MLLLIGELVFTLYLVILNFSVCHLRVRFRLVSRMAHWILLLVFARLAIVELPHGAGRVLRLLSAPGAESPAGTARDPVGVSAIENIAAVEWRDLNLSSFQVAEQRQRCSSSTEHQSGSVLSIITNPTSGYESVSYKHLTMPTICSV